jgi:hypothetical protein
MEAMRELLPGAIAGAAHGWIRTAHALWALGMRDTQTRRRELAHALASWAARYEPLPGTPGARASRGLDVANALARVPIVPAERRIGALRLLDQLRAVTELDGFADAIESVDLDAMALDTAIGALAAASARLFLANRSGRFAYLHAITATSALRLASYAMQPEDARRAVGCVFQVVAALHATNANAIAPPSIDVPRDRIVAKALETLDDHDVKLAVAMVREEAHGGAPEVRAAAATWLGQQ